MKITKKLLAACVAALALSTALMGGNTAKPAGNAAGSASKQTTEKKESKKSTDDRIELPPPGIGLFLLMSRTSRLIGQKVRPIQSLPHGWAAFLAVKTSVEAPPKRAANKSGEAPMGLRRSSGDIFARSLMPQALSSPCRPCKDAAPREW